MLPLAMGRCYRRSAVSKRRFQGSFRLCGQSYQGAWAWTFLHEHGKIAVGVRMNLYGSVVKMDLYDFVWISMADSNFGARLRDFRMKKKLSLQELADTVGASKAHVWDLEQGKTKNPSLGLLTSLSRALDVSIKDLVGESGELSENEPKELAPLFRDLRGLTSDQLELIQAMTNKLREMGDGDKSGGRSK